ncbi:MAG: hypothetical protein ACP5O8_00015 [Candidatus Aenigmatarchaeota archaeon]
MNKIIGGILLFFGTIFCLGAFGNQNKEMFLLEILFGPTLIYIGTELIK